jgi:hypothetical protein
MHCSLNAQESKIKTVVVEWADDWLVNPDAKNLTLDNPTFGNWSLSTADE